MSAARDAAWQAAIQRVDRAYSLSDPRALHSDRQLRDWAETSWDEGRIESPLPDRTELHYPGSASIARASTRSTCPAFGTWELFLPAAGRGHEGSN